MKKRPLSLSDTAALLQDGEKTRDLCPFCGGGSSKEVSFTITRTGQVANYICYRASCGAKGKVMYGGLADTVLQPAAPAKKDRPNRYYGKTGRMPVRYYNYFKQEFQIPPAVMDIYEVKRAEDGRVVFPIFDPLLRPRGDNLRVYPGLLNFDNIIAGTATDNPKSMVYMPNDGVLLSWHILPKNRRDSSRRVFKDTLLVVEDQVSAIKASVMVDAVALLGTVMSPNKIVELNAELIRTPRYKRVVIALDADATRRAITILQRNHGLMVSMSVRRLERDIKNMPYREITDLLNS